MSGLLAIAFGPRTTREAIETLPQLAQEADIVELRLDYVEDQLDVAPIVAARRGPIVATLRPPSQGGRCPWPAEERRAVLLAASTAGAEYVDIEWDAVVPAWVDRVKDAGAQVIVSRHDFAGMPPALGRDWWSQLAVLEPNVVKVVGTARHVLDCLEVFRAFHNIDRPTIAIAMGPAGLPTRVLAPREPLCFLTYAARDTGQATAPGQVSVAAMRDVYHVQRLDRATAAFGLLGPRDETAHAARYNAWFDGADLNAVAVPFLAEDAAAEVVSAFRELPVMGWHVHGDALQETVGQALDHLAPSACRAGKINAITLRADELVGEWVTTAEEQFRAWTNREPPT